MSTTIGLVISNAELLNSFLSVREAHFIITATHIPTNINVNADSSLSLVVIY
jgi:hypothetical protein